MAEAQNGYHKRPSDRKKTSASRFDSRGDANLDGIERGQGRLSDVDNLGWNHGEQGQAGDSPAQPSDGYETPPQPWTRSTRASSEERHVTIRERLSHFTWAWFEITMSTGALAILLTYQPFTFPGLQTIGKIVFILDLVLFLTFTGLISFAS